MVMPSHQLQHSQTIELDWVVSALLLDDPVVYIYRTLARSTALYLRTFCIDNRGGDRSKIPLPTADISPQYYPFLRGFGCGRW
jgi:hypothetical protein